MIRYHAKRTSIDCQTLWRPGSATADAGNADRGFLTTPRRGISLLEVLVSVFVITFGLLGVLAVIPVGRFEIVEIAKADRSAACGRANLRQAQVRGILNPGMWLARDLTSPVVRQEYLYTFNQNQGQWVASPTGRYGLRFGRSFAIDPLLIARNRDAVDIQTATFPYGLTAVRNVIVSQGLLPQFEPIRMQRVTLDLVSVPSAAVHQAVFGRMFTWTDDLNIPVPDADDERPRQNMFCLDDPANPTAILGGAWPVRRFANELPATAFPMALDSVGHYSWIITVTRRVGRLERPSFTLDMNGDNQITLADDDHHTRLVDPEPPGDTFHDYAYVNTRDLYDISIVVFHRRDLNYPPAAGEVAGERVALAPRSGFYGQGYGGGDVVLVSLPSPAGNAGDLEVREGQWLLLGGQHTTMMTSQLNPPTPAPLNRDVFKWYRIVAAGEIQSEDINGNGSLDPGEPDYNGNNVIDPIRFVTLEGPDWDLDWCFDIDGTGVHEAQAILFDGVIGVYTVTRESDFGSLWTY
jgi:hypothetical protein